MQRFPYALVALLMLISFATSSAQEVGFGDLDKSPMDAAHYPTAAAYQNYLAEDDPRRTQKIKVLYSRPQKKGRTLFGDLVKYGEDYRMGANEATEVTFFQNVEIGGTMVPRGVYTIFATPYPNEWIVKLSEERFIGGSANRDISKDVVAVSVPVKTVATEREYFTIGYKEMNENLVHMIFAWGNTQVELPIGLNPATMLGEDVSPMDLVQYPPMSRLRNYVEPEDLEANEPKVRVVYSRPQMKGREIFGKMLEYGSMWRVGANETTEVTFFDDVIIAGTEVKAGRYGLFATINQDSWEFILHNNVQSWGPNNHDPEDNVLTFSAPTEKTPETLEALSMTFIKKSDNEIHLAIGWENTMARLPITLK